MKKLISTLFIVLVTMNLSAQCITPPMCENLILVDGTLSNQTYNTNVCFEGNGNILGNVNWNDWEYLSFNGLPSSTPSENQLFAHQEINIAYDKNVYVQGNVYFSDINFTEADTLFVLDNSTVRIFGFTSNNSNINQYNAIVLGINSHLFIGLPWVEIFSGDTLHYGTNVTNNLFVVNCGLGNPLNMSISKFQLNKDIISWSVVNNADIIELQYTENPSNPLTPFRPIYFTSENEGNTSIRESGYYRLKVAENYSEQVIYNMTVLQPRVNRVNLYKVGNLNATKVIK